MINVVFLCFNSYDQKLVLFGTSQFTGAPLGRPASVLITFNFVFYLIVWSNLNGINDASLRTDDSGINVIS